MIVAVRAPIMHHRCHRRQILTTNTLMCPHNGHHSRGTTNSLTRAAHRMTQARERRHDIDPTFTPHSSRCALMSRETTVTPSFHHDQGRNPQASIFPHLQRVELHRRTLHWNTVLFSSRLCTMVSRMAVPMTATSKGQYLIPCGAYSKARESPRFHSTPQTRYRRICHHHELQSNDINAEPQG